MGFCKKQKFKITVTQRVGKLVQACPVWHGDGFETKYVFLKVYWIKEINKNV